MFRRLIAGAAVLTLFSVVLAACGGSSSSGTPGQAPSGSKLTSCDVGALKGVTKPVQIDFWNSMTSANLTTLQTLTNDFNASQSQVHVTLAQQADYNDTFEKYTTGLQNGEIPNLVQLQDIDLQQAIDTQSIIPAQSCLDASHYDTSDIIPRALSYFSVHNVLWGMPFNVSSQVLIYAKADFQKAGLDPNTPPTTLAELTTDAAALKRSGLQAGMGLKLEPGNLEAWIAMAGLPFANNDNGRTSRATQVEFDNATGRQLFTVLDHLVSSGDAQTNPALGPDAFDNLLGIGSGKYGMTIDTSASLGTIYQLIASNPNYAGLGVGVGPMPYLQTSDKGGVPIQGAALYISKQSSPEQQAAAWKYITFLDSTASQETWAAGTGYVPLDKSAAQSAKIQHLWAAQPGFKVAYDQTVAGPPTTAADGAAIGPFETVRYTNEVDAWESMYLSGATPDQAAASLQSNSNQTIASYNQRLG
jgi:sn-glycerol 3-phosphate transport system substrate-binding protein